MRLNEREQNILKNLELNANLSMDELAKRTRLQPHSVVYCIAKLKESQILGPRRASIDIYRLGFCDFHLVFSISTGNSLKREKFISALKSSPSVAWLAAIGGTHQFAMSIRATQVHEVLAFMAALRKSFPNFIRTQELSIVTAVKSYGREYLYGKRKAAEGFGSRVSDEQVYALDSTDKLILGGMSEFSLPSERELARLLGLPFSTVRRRIGILEKNKIINGYYHHIDAQKLGYQIFKLMIFCRAQDSTFLRHLEEFAAAHENIVHYLESFGSWQNELVVEVKEAAEASRIAAKVHEHFESQIDAVHVIPIFEYYKAVSFPAWSAERLVPRA